VGEGPFNEKLVADRTPLTTSLTITNFALWQIGLLALVFQEMNRGYVGVGGGTRKGQGQVQVAVERMVFRYAAKAYTVPSGIVSAQAALRQWLPESTYDVPAVVSNATDTRGVEDGLVLLATVDPQLSSDWREAGQAVLTVQEAQVSQLFREAVQQAWGPWVRHQTQTEVQA
jgi:hypothetical protein